MVTFLEQLFETRSVMSMSGNGVSYIILRHTHYSSSNNNMKHLVFSSFYDNPMYFVRSQNFDVLSADFYGNLKNMCNNGLYLSLSQKNWLDS